MPKKTQSCKVCKKSKPMTEYVKLHNGGYRFTCNPCVTKRALASKKAKKKGRTANGKRIGRPPGPGNKSKVKMANGLLDSGREFKGIFSPQMFKRLQKKAVSRVVITLDTDTPKIQIYRTEVTTMEMHDDS